MTRAGLLETMASGDLDAVTRAVGRSYRAGSVERLAAQDPQWGAAMERDNEVAAEDSAPILPILEEVA